MRRCRQLKGSIMHKHLLQPQDAATTHGPRGLPVPGCVILTELTGGQHTGVGNPARTIQSKHGRCVWLLGVDTGQFGLTVFVLVHFAGFGAAAFMAPLLQNLCLSMGNNEEACFCLKVRTQHYRRNSRPLGCLAHQGAMQSWRAVSSHRLFRWNQNESLGPRSL